MKSKGFTLIELFVTITIIGILSSVLFLGKTKGEERLALQSVAFQLAQDLREVQEMAMAADKMDCNGTETNSFGVHFKTNWKENERYYYILFADCNGNYTRDANDKDLRKVYLDKRVEITSLSPSSSFSVVFAPPVPATYINTEGWGMEGVITLSLKSDLSQTKKIKINSAGRIEIE
jgi:prepilin-type N-terminal cleavage/methylation domain-containing protein